MTESFPDIVGKYSWVDLQRKVVEDLAARPQAEAVLLPPQLSIREDVPVAEKIELAKGADQSHYKPMGGLWTSTLNEEGSEWLRWLTNEGYDLSMKRWGGKCWRLQPTFARVYVVWSPKQLHDLAELYPHPRQNEADFARIASFRSRVAWDVMAKEWDAVHVPNPWPWRFGYDDLGASMFFYSMDAESTCWFRWCFEGEPEELDPTPFLTKLKEGEA